MRNAELLHREIQAKWPTRAVLPHRFSAIRRIPSNYQRPSVWAIENKQHYVRDVTLCEDASRIRINPGIFARMRSFGYNILRFNQSDTIAQDRYAAAFGGLEKLFSMRY